MSEKKSKIKTMKVSGASITARKHRDGSITFTAKSRKGGVCLRNLINAMAGEPPASPKLAEGEGA